MFLTIWHNFGKNQENDGPAPHFEFDKWPILGAESTNSTLISEVPGYLMITPKNTHIAKDKKKFRNMRQKCNIP